MRAVAACLQLLALCAVCVGKRTYDTHNYYVLHRRETDASIHHITRDLGLELVGKAGELDDHWLVRVAKHEDQSIERHHSAVTSLSLQVPRRLFKRSSDDVATQFEINDPLFSMQWHLANDDEPGHDLNVAPVWEMGYTGKGVISSLIDDGLDYTSEDLIANFDADNSYDYNEHEALPTPKLAYDNHGTRCAGQIAALRNSVCGVGIAYASKVAGVRILSGPITDVDEAASLNYGYQNVSIYSCSWGPPDNGRTMDGAPHLVRKAILNGVNKGRGGKGSIYVFASGNGGFSGDQCNFDGYTNSIYSITVGAIDYKGLHPPYSEPCSANMIVAYSSGSGKNIITTDRGVSECAYTHGGTSAAAPNAVGVFALALEANPKLGWRDMQWLCVLTARPVNTADPDWENTTSGRKYSYKYGYGALDAAALVRKALEWKQVKPQTWYKTPPIQLDDGTMSKFNKTWKYTGGTPILSEGVSSSVEITPTQLAGSNFGVLEHITVKVYISHPRRGDVSVYIQSPGGIKSVLATPRPDDTDDTGFPGWTFMSVKHWGESAVGTWTIHVDSVDNPETEWNGQGRFIGWELALWGEVVNDLGADTILYQLPEDAEIFPLPVKLPASSTVATSSTRTTVHHKPTIALPTDHADQPGENTVPALPLPSSASIAEILRTNPTVRVSAGTVVLLALIALGVCVWSLHRRRKDLRAHTYARLPNRPTALNLERIGDEEESKVVERYRDEPGSSR